MWLLLAVFRLYSHLFCCNIIHLWQTKVPMLFAKNLDLHYHGYIRLPTHSGELWYEVIFILYASLRNTDCVQSDCFTPEKDLTQITFPMWLLRWSNPTRFCEDPQSFVGFVQFLSIQYVCPLWCIGFDFYSGKLNVLADHQGKLTLFKHRGRSRSQRKIGCLWSVCSNRLRCGNYIAGQVEQYWGREADPHSEHTLNAFLGVSF